MIGFIGGTGKQGRALAFRIAASGEKVILGSRSKKKAASVVERIMCERTNLDILPGTNEDAAMNSEILFVTLPYQSMTPTLKSLKKHLKEKIVVDVINPMTNNNIHKGISASEEMQNILKDSMVVCAFKNVSSYVIWNLDRKVDVDSIVCSDFEKARRKVIELSKSIGIPCVDGGSLENSLTSELLTRLLLQLNKKHGVETGIKITSYKI